MPAYAWKCRECGEEVVTSPKEWLVLESMHRLVHRLQQLAEQLHVPDAAELTIEVGA